ncbi:MAG: hypothetical protein ACLPHP_22350 [Candidatus Sulfotelmatobacter sp.]
MSNRKIFFVTVGCLALSVPPAIAQDAAGDANQPSLGEVVRHQKETTQKKAKRTLSDEDVPGSSTHTVWGDFATQVIIPNIRISAKAPATVKMNVPYTPDQKALVWFGPDLNRCFNVECAKATFLRDFHYELAGTPKILFETDDSVDGYPARIVHLELKNDTLGKMLGVVALITTPFSSSAPTCMYLEKDGTEMETACEQFIGSLELHIPEKYIYVQHPSY